MAGRLPSPPGGRIAPAEGGVLVPPPRKRVEDYRAGLLRTCARLLLWIYAVLRFVAGTLWDRLRRRDSTARRARRLRRTLERVGATLIKLGQQMSIRIDLIPYEYAEELSKMLDHVPAFPFAAARESIEQAAGRPLEEAFAAIDPQPVGSGSIACVYRGLLHDGTAVAIKVRRPGIEKLFAADMRALGWLLWASELFILPPETTRHFLFELRTMLFEELDFLREARFNELFRLQSKKANQRFVTAPKIYFELSSTQVLVAEYVTGIWLTEVLRAVESGDETFLAHLRELDITPKRLARRLLRNTWFQGQEGYFFHADLHPANLLVRPGCKITFIDFGSCGAFTEKERRVWRHLLFAQGNEDVGSMVQAAVALLEPLPPIDVNELSRRLEAIFWQDLYAHKSRHAQWWERTSANIWIGFLKIAREYRIPMNLNTLRMIRATMLSDTLAARLYARIDHYKEYRRYQEAAGRRARKRLGKKLERLEGDPAWLRYEAMLDAGFTSLYQVQRTLDNSQYIFSRLETTVGYGTALVLRTAFNLGLATGLLILGTAVWRSFSTDLSLYQSLAQMLTGQGWRAVVANGWYLAFASLVVLANARRLVNRLDFKKQ